MDSPAQKRILEMLYRRLKDGTFRWDVDSYLIARYCPQHFDPNKYNWKNASWYVARYCPQHFDPKLFNWQNEEAVQLLRELHPELLLLYLQI